MEIPVKKQELLDQASLQVREIDTQYQEGLITAGEKYNKVVDIWADTTERVAREMMNSLSKDVFEGPEGQKKEVVGFNPIFIMADSGARGSAQQMRQLAGMRGLMAKPSGEIIETPITANFREGLTALQYFISTHGARKGLADTALKTANSGYLTRRLVDVAQDAIVSEYDCKTPDSIEVGSLIEGGEIIEHLGSRILGRVAPEDIKDPFTDEVIVKKDEQVTEEHVAKIEESGLEKVRIRSVLTCRSDWGICVQCYGRDLARGHLVNIGEAVGVIAAQSIGEPGTQLTMRTFHIGGTASRRVEQSTLESRHEGVVKFINLKSVQDRYKSLKVMNRNGEVAIVDDEGRERERYQVIYGARILVKEGDRVKNGTLMAEWDPYTTPIVTEVGGTIKFGDIVEGVSMREEVDQVSGLSTKVISESKDPSLRPRISVKDEKDGTKIIPGSDREARYLLPLHAHLIAAEGDAVEAGDVIAKIPRETTKTKDITGGLPRVAELFEARKPKDCAVVTEIEGVVSFGKDTKGKRKVIITPEVGEPEEYLIPRAKHIAVHEGDHVRPGDPLMDGASNPHDILKVMGEKELAKYLVDEIQEVYRLQGVQINDKHIETIVRQMLRRIRILDPGDSSFLIEEQVEKQAFRRENERIKEAGGKPAVGEPMLLGITKASLSIDSFISAASFQETTKVLTEAAVSGKTDFLRGLKENVIMGRLIPAGTGFTRYQQYQIEVKEEGNAAEESVPPGAA